MDTYESAPSQDVVICDINKYCAHTRIMEHLITSLLREFMDEHADKDLDVPTLIETFKTHCVDFMDDLSLDSDKKSLALEFYCRIICELVPEAREVIQGRDTNDKAWKFIFNHKSEHRSKWTILV
ncbi:PREDICTED: uncharacterized protein LOC108554492 [Eufriesea mexicana]|uniref:uncharacterized protein LOC108554492 n=1 Tax=Eufriesea mexicana TaxID=516756 RepID=UPI00083C4ACD|nr:PREDICTED: uncharacterized protein LOC108554492 [Eufriesea mexicana]